MNTQGVTMTATVADARAEAAKARAAALGGVGGSTQRSAPQEVGLARMLPAQAQMRAKLETRGDQQYYHLEGIASVTDTPYEMWDVFGSYNEVIDRAAFTDTLAANPDVAFLINHKGLTMARTSAGTLQLGMADEGLKSDAWLNPKRQDVKDLILAIEERSITEMSFAFMIEDGGGWWSEDFTTFRITKLNIDRGDVSAVNYGANPYTSIAARSREIFSDLNRLPTGAARAALNQLAARQDLTPAAPEPQPEPAPEASVAFYEALLNLT